MFSQHGPRKRFVRTCQGCFQMIQMRQAQIAPLRRCGANHPYPYDRQTLKFSLFFRECSKLKTAKVYVENSVRQALV